MENNSLKIFNSDSFGDIRVTQGEDGEPRFCLMDICRALDLTAKGVKQRLEDEVISNYPIVDKIGRQQFTLFVNEDGLYDVILESRKPEAKAFRKWVTSEVLPSIRRHGAYMSEDALKRAISEPDFLIQLATQIKEERNKRLLAEQFASKQSQQIAEMSIEIQQKRLTIQAQTIRIDELEKTSAYVQAVLASKSTVTITQIAQDYGFTAKAFNKKLHEMGIQYKVGRQWILYSKYIDKGYVQSETIVIDSGRTVMNTKWTQEGRLFLYNILKSSGIYPLIEK